ncbi:MAG: ATP-binding protein [Desulfosarcina sp.]
MSKTAILIVEDEPIVAADLAGKLERLGYAVAGTTGQGEEAIQMAGHLHPQLILMDIWLEGTPDGIETADRITKQCDIPIIYLTAHSDDATFSRAKLTGPLGYIRKPLDDRELAIQIELALYKHCSARQLREGYREMTEYAHVLTHNLKAPFRSIQNYADFLLEDLKDSLSGEPKKYLEGIMAATRQANQQFADLDALYGVRGRSRDADSFDMRELLDELEQRFNDRSDQRLILPRRKWPLFCCGQFFMRQMLIELVENGMKFNHSESKWVEIDWQLTSSGRVEISVRDNGIGFDPQHSAHIFDIYRRLHTDREFEGTGIGLAIVKTAVQKLDGNVRAQSILGQGSTFFISLPDSILDH